MRTTILSIALVVLIGGADAFAQGSSSVSKNSGGGASGGGGGGVIPGAGRSSPATRQRCAQREEPERSERSAEQGKRSARPQDQEHLPRLLGRALIADMGVRNARQNVASDRGCRCLLVRRRICRRRRTAAPHVGVSSGGGRLFSIRRAQGNPARETTRRSDEAADRGPYVDPAAPYKANRLSSPRATEPILNIPGQTTVLTREVLDDMKATSVRDALRSTAGVTVGR